MALELPIGRSGRIRTCDPGVPNAVLYQTEPHSEIGRALYRGGPHGRQPAGRCEARGGALSRPPSRPTSDAAIPAGEWCNGNTAVFGTVILGSSPSSPANLSALAPVWSLGRSRSAAKLGMRA